MRVYLIGALVAFLFAGGSQIAIGGWGHWGTAWDDHGWFHELVHHALGSDGDGHLDLRPRIRNEFNYD